VVFKGHTIPGEVFVRTYLATVEIITFALTAVPSLAEEVRQPAAAPSTSPAPRDGEDTWQSILHSHDIQSALGKEVRSGTGENLGRIADILVDKGGRVRAAVIDFGGFLGVGSRKIVVDWAALHFPPAEQGDPITLGLTRDQVSTVPEYKPGQPVVVLGSRD
jgi:PRC-barrel domain